MTLNWVISTKTTPMNNFYNADFDMMIKFSYEKKIYAVWDLDHCTDPDPKNMFDASADGLSGTKEGFYFANWLMPFTLPFHFQDVAITPSHYPLCLEGQTFPCNTCTFFTPDQCPILEDKININLTIKGFEFYRKAIFVPKGRCDDIFDAIHKELLTHGKPLHYKVLIRILIDRYPDLPLKPQKVLNILRVNPIFFKDCGDGVYGAIRDRVKSEETSMGLELKWILTELME